jgi:hypothetical protein
VDEIRLSVNANGSLTLSRDTGAILGTSAAGILTTGRFWYVELSAYVSASDPAAAITVRVTELPTLVSTVVLTVVGINSTASEGVDAVALGGPAASNWWVNDFYNGANANGNFVGLLGPIQVRTVLGDGNGNPWLGGEAEWTPPAPGQFALVNEVPPDDGATTISCEVGADATSRVNLYTMPWPALAPAETVIALQTVIDGNPEAFGNLNELGTAYDFAGSQISGASTNFFSVFVLGDWEIATGDEFINPLSGLDWTQADLVNLQAGPRVIVLL